MNFFSADGLYSSSGLIESFKQDSSTTFNLKPAFRDFTKDINKALSKMDYSTFKSNDFVSVKDITNSKDEDSKPLELRDKKENPFFVKVDDKNQICVTKNNQTLCFANKDFKSVGPTVSESSLKQKISKSRLKPESLKEKQIKKSSPKKSAKRSSPKKSSPKKSAKRSSPKKSSPKKSSPKKSSPKKSSKKKSSKRKKNIKKLNKEIRKSLPKEETEETEETTESSDSDRSRN